MAAFLFSKSMVECDFVFDQVIALPAFHEWRTVRSAVRKTTDLAQTIAGTLDNKTAPSGPTRERPVVAFWVRHDEGSFLFFLCFMTQATWLRIDKVTPHQCWNVCDWETWGKPNKRSSPLAHDESQDTNLPTVAFTPSKRGTHLILNLLQPFTRTRWHKGTGHPRSRGTPCLNCIKNFEGNRPATSTQRDMSFTSLSLLQRKTRSEPESATFPFNFMHFLAQHACPGLYDSLRPRFSLAG